MDTNEAITKIKAELKTARVMDYSTILLSVDTLEALIEAYEELRIDLDEANEVIYVLDGEYHTHDLVFPIYERYKAIREQRKA